MDISLNSFNELVIMFEIEFVFYEMWKGFMLFRLDWIFCEIQTEFLSVIYIVLFSVVYELHVYLDDIQALNVETNN
jgi:hypothetical protein